MPLTGFESLCGANDKQIVSRDKGNPQYHKAINTAKSTSTGKSIFEFDKNSPVAEAYKNLAKEVLDNERTRTKNFNEVENNQYIRDLINIQKKTTIYNQVHKYSNSNIIDESIKVLEYRINYMIENKYKKKTNKLLLATHTKRVMSFFCSTVVLPTIPN